MQIARSEISPVIEVEPGSQQSSAFKISKEELEILIVALAPKVNLFKVVWEQDPKAQFYGGTSRDFIYWILGNFRGISDPEETEEKIRELLKLEIIDIRDIVGRNSDIDVIPSRPHARFNLNADDFGIRKIDHISADILDSRSPLGENEINQGFIPLEKILLSSRGITTNIHNTSPLEEFLRGELSIHFPENMEKFYETHFAKTGSNHPVLLAVRYIRLLAVDYYRRYGTQTPDFKTPVVISKSIASKIRTIFQSASTDPRFITLLENLSGLRWLNESILKSFRSYTNGAAALLLFKILRFSELQMHFRNKIESLNQFLFRKVWDEKTVSKNWSALAANEKDYLISAVKFTKDYSTLLHGAGTDDAFFGILRYGAIPSETGSAGFGLYATTAKNKSFASQWKESGIDRVVKLTIKPAARIFDLRSRQSHALYETWRKLKQKEYSTASLDQFCEELGIDILFYEYDVEAAVIKNSSAIESVAGLTRNPLTLGQTYELVKNLKSADELRSLLLSLTSSHMTSTEIRAALSKIPMELVELSTLKTTFENIDPVDIHPSIFQAILELCKSHKLVSQTQLINEILGAQFGRADKIFRSLIPKKKRQVIQWMKELSRYEPNDRVLSEAIKVFPRIYSVGLTADLFFREESHLKWRMELLPHYLKKAGGIIAEMKSNQFLRLSVGRRIRARVLAIDLDMELYGESASRSLPDRYGYIAHIVHLAGETIRSLARSLAGRISSELMEHYFIDFYLPIMKVFDFKHLTFSPIFLDYLYPTLHSNAELYKTLEELTLRMIVVGETNENIKKVVLRSFEQNRNTNGIYFWLSKPMVREKLFLLFDSLAKKNLLTEGDVRSIIDIFLHKSNVEKLFPHSRNGIEFEKGLVHFLKLASDQDYGSALYLEKIVDWYPESLSVAKAAVDALKAKWKSGYRGYKIKSLPLLISKLYVDIEILIVLKIRFPQLKIKKMMEEYFTIYRKTERRLQKQYHVRIDRDPIPQPISKQRLHLIFNRFGRDRLETDLDIRSFADGRAHLQRLYENCSRTLRELKP